MTFKINNVEPLIGDQVGTIVAHVTYTWDDNTTADIDVMIPIGDPSAATVEYINISCNNRGITEQRRIDFTKSFNSTL